MRVDPRGLVLVAVLGLAACNPLDVLLHGPGAGKTAEAEKRVNEVMAGMQKAGDTTSTDLQEAMCQWYKGSRFLRDRDEQEAALDGFDRWRRERKMYNRRIGSYELVEAEVVPDREPLTVLVTVDIEGKAHQILVPDGRPMSWQGRAPSSR